MNRPRSSASGINLACTRRRYRKRLVFAWAVQPHTTGSGLEAKKNPLQPDCYKGVSECRLVKGPEVTMGSPLGATGQISNLFIVTSQALSKPERAQLILEEAMRQQQSFLLRARVQAIVIALDVA